MTKCLSENANASLTETVRRDVNLRHAVIVPNQGAQHAHTRTWLPELANSVVRQIEGLNRVVRHQCPHHQQELRGVAGSEKASLAMFGAPTHSFVADVVPRKVQVKKRGICAQRLRQRVCSGRSERIARQIKHGDCLRSADGEAQNSELVRVHAARAAFNA